ncbi:Peptidoglycan/LPS O-acetylase OafA/YrhL [Candidatus Electronema halotolerans]
MRSQKDWLVLTAALLLYAVLHIVCSRALSGAAFVEVVAELDHRDRFQVFYSGGSDFSEQHSFFSAMIEPGQPQTVRIALHSASVRRLRLDLGEQPGTVRLHQMTVAGIFAQDAALSAADIFRLFSSHAPDAAVRLDQDAVTIQTGKDSYIVCNEPLLGTHSLLLYFLPPAFAFFIFLLLQQTAFSKLAPFADLRDKRPSVGKNIAALDGLRAIAVIMVVADHTWGLFSGLGASGVWIFMTLSGFLIARPFIQQPERAVSLSYLRHFFIRRAKRILPVYCAYILVVFVFSGRFDEAALHLLFLKGSGHLWVVPQEMLFYLLTPPLMLTSCLLLGSYPLLVIPALTALMLAANRFLDQSVLALLGMDNVWLRLYLGVFLAGVIASWLHHGIWLKKIRPDLRQRCRSWAAGAVIAILLFFLLCSEEHLWGGKRIFTQIYFPWFGAAAAMLILAALAAEDAVAVRFLSSLPLRALSLVSFSVYIFHTLILDILRKGAELYCGRHLTGAPLFLLTLFGSYLFACITYSLIERPFLRPA